MKIVIDVSLSPRWVDALGQRGREAIHWSSVGKLDAEDMTILEWVSDNGAVLLSCDCVIQIRGKDVLPEVIVERVAMVISGLEHELQTGALVSLDTDQARVRVLPLRAQPTAKAREVMNMARRIAAILLLEPALDANYRAGTAATWAWDLGPKGGTSET